jgi:hypothetical protein
MTDKKYRVCWKDKRTGRITRSRFSYPTFEKAKSMADEYDDDFTDCEHWVEPVEKEASK